MTNDRFKGGGKRDKGVRSSEKEMCMCVYGMVQGVVVID